MDSRVSRCQLRRIVTHLNHIKEVGEFISEVSVEDIKDAWKDLENDCIEHCGGNIHRDENRENCRLV